MLPRACARLAEAAAVSAPAPGPAAVHAGARGAHRQSLLPVAAQAGVMDRGANGAAGLPTIRGARARLMIATAMEDLAQCLLAEGKPLPSPDTGADADAGLIELVPLPVRVGASRVWNGTNRSPIPGNAAAVWIARADATHPASGLRGPLARLQRFGR